MSGCYCNVMEEIEYFLNRYEFGSMLGEGGNGKVFEGFRRTDNLHVAIKKVSIESNTEFVDDEDEHLSIPFELFAMKRLRDIPGVVRLIDWCVTDKLYFLVMEHLGSDLSELPEPSDVDEEICKDIIRSLLDTVISCKERGIIHNDLKLENICYDFHSGSLKLIDFGNSEFFRPGPVDSFHGTPLLYPPEWLKKRRHEMEATTVWTLGIITYELSQGITPFCDDEKILDPTLQFRIDYPRLNSFVKKCLRHHRRWSLDQLRNHRWLMEE